MKTHPLTKEQIDELLHKVQTGSLATINSDGTPYIVPVHFLYLDNLLYIHGLPVGKKIDNIIKNPNICLSVYEMDCLLLDPNGNPCDTNTKYQSVIINGTAALVEDIENKRNVLNNIVKKYTPHLFNKTLPENMIKGTAVIQLSIHNLTGKYYS